MIKARYEPLGASGCARYRVRRGLQPRAVAGDHLGRGHPADGRGGRQPGDRRGFLLVEAAASAGRADRRLARPGPRPAGRGGDRGRPGHRHGVAAALARRRAPGDPAGHDRRPTAGARRPPALLPKRPGLPRGRRGSRGPDGTALRRPSGRHHVACRERVRLPRARLLLPALGGGVQGLAPGALRRARPAERGLGRGGVEPGLHQLGPGGAAADGTHLRQPGPAARLRPVQLGRTARLLSGRA